MAMPPGPYYPTNDLVAVAWLGQRIPGIVAGQVATTLPSDVRAWADEGFIQISVIGGTPDIDVPIRRPIVQLDFWAATVDASGSISAKPPWNKANRLAELVRVAIEEGQVYGKEVTLPAGYLGARVLGVRLDTEPLRMEGDPSGYAHISADISLDWVRMTEAGTTPPPTPTPVPDTTPPAVPTGLQAASITASGFALSWAASASATLYEVQVNGVIKGTPSVASLAVSGLTVASPWSVRVRARDAAGNWSALSAALTVTAPVVVVEPPAGSPTHNVFGALTPATYTRYNDGGTILLLNCFYTYGADRAAWRARGVRVYRPVGAAVAPGSIHLLIPTTNAALEPALAAAPVKISASFTDLVEGWNDILLPEPVALTPAQPVYAGYSFADGTYIHGPMGSTPEPITSTPPGLAFAGTQEAFNGHNWNRSAFSTNGGVTFTSAPGSPSYAIDLIVDEG